MPRTTLDIDLPVLRDLKRLQKSEHKSLGRLVSELCARALASLSETPRKRPAFHWIARNMGVPRVDIADKDAVFAVLDGVRR